MSVAELMPTLRGLSPDDKVYVVETLMRDLSELEGRGSAKNAHRWWVYLTDEEKEGERLLIERSVQAGREGRVSSLDDVVNRLRAKYPVPLAEAGV